MAQEPIRAPTAKGMKMAERPVATPSTMDWLTPSQRMPFLWTTTPATTLEKIRAICLGPSAESLPSR
jgi:hypothetical protein